MSSAPSVSLQRATISSNLNSSLLFQYLVGIYIGVYFITIYLYTYRIRSLGSWITLVSGCLTALFGIAIYECFAQWYNTTTVFSTQGTSRSDLFDLSFFGSNNVPKWIPILSIIANDAGYVIADGLMIWRCFHITNRSVIRLALPLLFFSTEIALALTENVIYILLNFRAEYNSVEHAKLFDNLDATMGFVTAGTSLLATFTIARQIYISTTNHSSLRKRYAHIIEITIQSSVIYSLAILGMAICNIFLYVNGNPYTSLTAGIIIRYLAVIAVIVTGLSPTLMVMRLALAPKQDYDSRNEEYSASLQVLDISTLDNDTTHNSRSEAMRSSEWANYQAV